MKKDESEQLFEELRNLVTEQSNPKTVGIDTEPAAEILRLISEEDAQVHDAVRRELPYIAHAVEIITEALKRGGRLFYIGAGTSGRLGVLDASECPPTFGTDPEVVQGIIAGGYEALVRSREGVEDREERGAADLEKRGLTERDVVCGITASKRTPYVLGALRKARSAGAKTIYITCTPRGELALDIDVAICPVVGPEVIMGSTRMKAGTAQKMVLNMLTTASFILMGKVYKNMMIDLQMTSRKLIERSKRIVMMVTDVDYRTASRVLKEAGGHVKCALVMILANVSREEAQRRLRESGGFVRTAL
ncbi:N-acetylmuramic acid 6-phosphate etherase [candidate division KSB1 bacterium]